MVIVVPFHSLQRLEISKGAWEFDEFLVRPTVQHISLDADSACDSRIKCRQAKVESASHDRSESDEQKRQLESGDEHGSFVPFALHDHPFAFLVAQQRGGLSFLCFGEGGGGG